MYLPVIRNVSLTAGMLRFKRPDGLCPNPIRETLATPISSVSTEAPGSTGVPRGQGPFGIPGDRQGPDWPTCPRGMATNAATKQEMGHEMSEARLPSIAVGPGNDPLPLTLNTNIICC